MNATLSCVSTRRRRHLLQLVSLPWFVSEMLTRRMAQPSSWDVALDGEYAALLFAMSRANSEICPSFPVARKHHLQLCAATEPTAQDSNGGGMLSSLPTVVLLHVLSWLGAVDLARVRS